MAEAVLHGFLINQCWTLLIIFAALLSCNAVPGALLLHYHKSTVAQALTYSVTLTMHNFVLVEFFPAGQRQDTLLPSKAGTNGALHLLLALAGGSAEERNDVYL
jgi:hypothetical protein